MIFKGKNMPDISENVKICINDSILGKIGNNSDIKYYKFVGVLLDENISWDHQLIHVSNKNFFRPLCSKPGKIDPTDQKT